MFSRPNDPTSEEIWSIFARAICPIVPLISCDREARPVTIYAVPTANLASLELNECKKEGVDNLKYARANLRQDVSDGAYRATSDCLVYLGATGSMQFLADFRNSDGRLLNEHRSGQRNNPVVIVVSGDSGQPSAPVKPLDAHPFAVVFDARSGAVSAQGCDLDLVAVVGPFQTGTTEMQEPKECLVPEPERGRRIETVVDIASKDLGNYGTLVLVGRADVRPINNQKYGSNMALARARVKEVADALDDHHPSVHVLSISAGPVDSPQGADACSRVVEIYGCPADRPSASAGTTGAAGAGGRP